MADKTIGELPQAPQVIEEAMIPLEQQGTAMRMSGKQFADFAREAAAADVERAIRAAADAEQAKSDAEETLADVEAIRGTIVVDQQALAQAVSQTQESEEAAGESAGAAEDSAKRSESWAVGGTGTREGEDTDNSKYYAGLAQAEAERATVPAVEGVYNVVLQDRVTSDRYALIVEDGVLKLLGVAESLDAATLTLIDAATGTAYAVVVDSGRLAVEEV